MVAVARLFGIRVNRISMDFTSLAVPLLNLAEQRKLRVGVIGSTQEDIEQTISFFCEKYPQLNIVYFRNGFFNGHKIELINDIYSSNLDLLILGLGAPLQEQFMEEILSEPYERFSIVTCGGFIEQTASEGEFYPKFIDKFQIRFLYRIYKKPILLKRYLFMYPKGLLQFLVDLIGSRN
jgi:N-acetylglucosaminyldiphosphoundecaprenol N-acetyl-beta-D-mannosaminyltransferase